MNMVWSRIYDKSWKKILSAAAVFTLSLMLTGYAPASATYGEEEKPIPWQSVFDSQESGFAAILRSGQEIPYVPLENRITFRLPGGTAVDTVTIEDMILDENGKQKYEGASGKTETLEVVDGAVSYYLGVNWDAMKSRDSATYKKGGVVRGLRILYSTKQGKKESYDLVLKTDAAMGSEGKTGSVYFMLACGTGIPVFSNIESIKEKSDGLLVRLKLENVFQDNYSYEKTCFLSRENGEGGIKLPCKQGFTWKDKRTYTLKGGKSAVLKLDLGKAYGVLEPGIYTISIKLVNKTTGEPYWINDSFQYVEKK